MKRLIVSADDLGLHPGINAGILRCHREGIVTGASLSANGAAFDDAVQLLAGAPQLDVGLHLTLVGEAPLSPPGEVPSLAPGGRLPASFAVLFRRLFLGRVREQDVEQELVAQLARARDAGLAVSHLDSHQHVHLHPRIFPVVLRVARRFGIRAVRAARRILPLRSFRSFVLAPFSRRGSRQARQAGFETPDAFLGMAETGRLDEARLLRLIARMPPGTSELVCHPGSGDAAIAASYDWGFQWDLEAQALTSPRVREALERGRIQLTRYADL